MTSVDIVVHQNEYLPVGATEVNAVVRVSVSGGRRHMVGVAEILIIDVSGSMQTDGKIDSARAATIAAIGCLRDGVAFAVIAGSSRAHHVFPTDGTLATASADTRAAAAQAVQGVQAGGGTAIATWLMAAHAIFATREAPINHAILLTDGQDQQPDLLGPALEACEGRFQCDCRGVGADWDVTQLRRIASSLLGDVGLIREAEQMSADFTDLMERSMGKGVPHLTLRVWTPLASSVALIKQAAPTVEDLTPRRTIISERVSEYPTGAWGDETRDFHLRIRVPARQVDEEMLAARASVVIDDVTVAEGKVRAVWTVDEALSTRLNGHVVRSTGHAEYADAVQEGVAALREGDDEVATAKLGRAAQLAYALHDEDKLAEVARVVQIEDATTGTVRTRTHVDELDLIEVDTNSTRTVRTRSAGP